MTFRNWELTATPLILRIPAGTNFGSKNLQFSTILSSQNFLSIDKFSVYL